MKLRRMLSLLLALVLMASAVGTISVSAENSTEYQAIESFQVSTDNAPVPYYMGAQQMGEAGSPYYFLKGGSGRWSGEWKKRCAEKTALRRWRKPPRPNCAERQIRRRAQTPR